MPGESKVDATRNTWLTRKCSRGCSLGLALGTCGSLATLPRIFFWLEHLRHVAHSQCSRDAHSVRALGTRGVPAMLPGMLTRLSTRDTWRTRVAQNGFKTPGAILGRRIGNQWQGLVGKDRTRANSLGGFKPRDSSGPSDQRWM